MPGVDTNNQTASNKGAGYDGKTLNSTTDPERLVSIGTETRSIAIIAETGRIYVGFDDNLDSDNGFPLDEGVSISLDLDVNQEDIYVLPEASGNDVRWIATA
jgi:hypothetical protein